MHDESSILQIFQDPLLTIIALVLLSTLWIVIPEDPGDTAAAESPAAAVEVATLPAEIAALRSKTDALREEIQRFQDALAILDSARADRRQETERRSELDRELATARTVVHRLQAELAQLEQEIEAARARAGESESGSKLQRKVDELRRTLAEKKERLEALERELGTSHGGLSAAAVQATEGTQLLVDLQQRVAAEKEHVDALRTERQDLARAIEQAAGMAEYTADAVAGRQEIVFELIGNRSIAFNESNYDPETFQQMWGSQVVTRTKWELRSSATRESPERVSQRDSEFRRVLAGYSPQTHYVFFGVQTGSFEIFRKLRQIAWEQGYVTSWAPWEAGPLYRGGGDARLGR